MRIKAET